MLMTHAVVTRHVHTFLRMRGFEIDEHRVFGYFLIAEKTRIEGQQFKKQTTTITIQ